jgi:hypothetical protein
MSRLALYVAALLAAFGIVSCASAAPLAKPAGPVVLTVRGAIANTNADGAAMFDLAMLDALAGRTADVETPWTKGRVAFKGPLGKALLDAVGGSGKTLRVKALNDYTVDIPAADFVDHAVILATSKNGEPMSVREHGPIFIIYPFDREPGLYTEQYFSRSVWQVASITVLN